MTSDIQLRRLTPGAFERLREHAAAHPDDYCNPDTDFAKILESLCDKRHSDPLNVTIDPAFVFTDPRKYSKNPRKRHLADKQALDFYKSLKGMTPKLASDPYILAYLNHFCFHKYGIQRWPITEKEQDVPTSEQTASAQEAGRQGSAKRASHILLHWLTTSSQRQQIWNSSISGRTWWIAHIATKAAGASGGAFTAKDALDLFANRPEYYHRTMEYAVLRHPPLLAECIRALMNEASGINRDGYREMGMELNREAGARLLDSLSRSDLRGLVTRSANRLMRMKGYVNDRHDLVGARKFKVLSLGAGAQSTVLALMAEEGWEGLEKPDLAIFADTRWEPRAVYDHLEWLKSRLSYKVVTVTAGSIRDNMLRGVNPDGDTFLDVPVFIRNPNGTKAVAARQCTTHYKITPIHREIRKRLKVPAGKRVPKDVQVEMWLGISADESIRMKPSRDEWLDNRYPLIEKSMTRADIYKWFGDRYPDRHLPRSACVGCPYHDDMEWKWLKENEPESFKDAVNVDWSLRNVPAARGSLRGEAYLHKSRMPLGDVDFSQTRDYDDYMATECEGLCGV